MGFKIENGILKEYNGEGGEVEVPSGVTTIWDAFSEAKYIGCEVPHPLTGITLPEGLKTVGDSAFSCCFSLKKVLLPESLTVIGRYAFYSCTELTDCVLPKSVTEIGDHAFAGCKKLKITLPPELKSIEEAAFRDCAMTKIVIPAQVTQIGKDAFLRCNKIKTAGPVGGGYDYEFPWTEEIPDNAFSGLRKLKKAVLPASVKKVGNNAFKDCKELVDVTMPKTAKVSKTAFKGCDKLTNVKEPEDTKTAVSVPTAPKKESMPDFITANGRLVKYNGREANVVVPDGIEVIGENAFYGNQDVTSVVLPESVHTVEREAFDSCDQLTSVTFPGTIQKAGSRAFGWLYDKPALELQVYSAIPVKAFGKSEQDDILCTFCRRFDEFDSSSQVYRDNIAFMGSHLKQDEHYKRLLPKDEVRHAVLEAKAIPAKDVDWLLDEFQKINAPEMVSEILEYKNSLFQDPKVKKAQEKREKKDEERAFSTELTAADWRKIYKYSYDKDGFVVIKGIKAAEEILTIPAKIGTKAVQTLAGKALGGVFTGNGSKHYSPKEIHIPEGVTEIKRGAIFCLEGTHIYFPTTITTLPEGLLIAATHITLHLTGAVAAIADELAWDSVKPLAAIYAPAGSFAEQYAKENKIPFVAE